MRTAILACLVVLLSLVLLACDDRANEKPAMTFTSDTTELTNTAPDMNFCNLTVVLDGEDAVTIDEKINFTYDHTRGNLIGQGSNEYARTDTNGVAHAEFTVTDSTWGSVLIDASMDKFPSVHQSITLTVTDCPRITVSADPESALADGVSQITITAQLESNSDNIADQTVTFTSDLALEADSLTTDADGTCVNHVTAGDTPGNYSVFASVTGFPGTAIVIFTLLAP
ncbi:MAG: Ig-like domain-containing protein [Candidatus Cloacimonetes bacterium]|nr:Ig-like domain-containing protein [Candidatus Cloacimonadota bacterium]